MSCIFCSDDHTLHGSNSNLLNPCLHDLHGRLANFLCILYHVSLAAITCVVTVVHTASIILVCVLRPWIILHIYCLNHWLYFMWLSAHLLLDVLHRVGHMMDWCVSYLCNICQYLLLLHDFLQTCNHIAHHVLVVHAGFFNGEIRGFSEFLLFCPEKLFEPNPRPLDCCQEIPFANRQSELAHPVKNYVSYDHRLLLGVQNSDDVG